MSTYYDDNFGQYDIRDEEDIEFYFKIQKTNVEKECNRCGRLVMIQPHYAICNSCADILERGGDCY